MNKKVTSLKGIEKVRVNDFSEYDSEKSSNGGKYGFWTDYTRLENGKMCIRDRQFMYSLATVIFANNSR